MASIKSIGKFFVFVIGGLVTIIVGAFMLRGNMHLWDKQDPKNDKD